MANQPLLAYMGITPLAMPTEQSTGAPRHMAYWDWAALDPAHAQHVVVCVHGLSRQGRDFDTLAQTLRQHARVVCPDVAGRGHSSWLPDPLQYQIPTYAQDMAQLLLHLRQEGVSTIDWVGTSMGGLIGIALAAQVGLQIRRLVLNDVGPVLEASALQRIGTYLGQPVQFESQQAGIDYLLQISPSFGPHTPEQWHTLSAPMLRQQGEHWTLHYDPAIAAPFKAMTGESAQAAAQAGQAMLWQLYDAITAPTLLLRGAQSDLLTPDTAQAMTQRGPRAQLVVFDGVGHAPTLVATEQIKAVQQFLFST